jgi:hypothetical protein
MVAASLSDCNNIYECLAPTLRSAACKKASALDRLESSLRANHIRTFPAILKADLSAILARRVCNVWYFNVFQYPEQDKLHTTRTTGQNPYLDTSITKKYFCDADLVIVAFH